MDVDDEEVEDSRTDESPCCLRKLSSSGVLCRTTGGLLCKGLACRTRVVDFVDNATPGEYDDIDVGVEDTLNAPGDSEYRVEGVVEIAYCGIGRGRISVGPI